MNGFWFHKRAIKWLFSGFIITSISWLSAQERQSIGGKIVDRATQEPIEYANIRLFKTSDSTLVGGAVSDNHGIFAIQPVARDTYCVRISCIGYEETTKSIVVDREKADAGTIYLQEKAETIREAVVVVERAKAKSERDKTAFFISKKMTDVSNTGTDLLKLIPGIQIDFMQNISLEGSNNILILVDGKERDRNFIRQLNPKEIDKIEVISSPPANYDGNATGVINVVLKKEHNAGISGQINAEIPTSSSAIYIFPNYNLSLGWKKLTFFTSYNGEMSYFDIHESTYRKTGNKAGTTELFADQYVKQRNWSHRFNYGFDYTFDKRNQLSFYGFYNVYSNGHNGTTISRASGVQNRQWEAIKKDTDKNRRNYYSLFYNHRFNTTGHELSVEASNYHLNAENSTEYHNIAEKNILATNIVKPQQNAFSIKADYTRPLTAAVSLAAGIKTKLQTLTDRNTGSFHYNENSYAAYGALSYKQTKFDTSLGLRTEQSESRLNNSFDTHIFAFLPSVNIRFQLSDKQNIRFSFSRSIARPNLYQLNPAVSIDDPFTVRVGNPTLKPEFRTALFLEHSIRFASNYFATRLFYNKTTDAINKLTFVNDTCAFETKTYNLGTIHQYGIQLSGSFKLGIATLNPYVRIYGLHGVGNNTVQQYAVKNKRTTGIESGLSAIVSVTNTLALSLSAQYATPLQAIQSNTFCDALYFVSLDKTITENLKIGAVSGLPFARKFTYAGSDTDGNNFSSRYNGYLLMPTVPLWFRVSYQFHSGKKRSQIKRETEEPENLPKRGF
jgi:hypothetical protein